MVTARNSALWKPLHKAEIPPVPADSSLAITDHNTLVYYAKCMVLLEIPEMEMSPCLPN